MVFGMEMFDIMTFIFPIFFILFFAVFIIIIFKNIREWSHNNKQPVIPVVSTVISKRSNVSHSHNSTTNTGSSSTTYYVTFQFDNNERLELRVSGENYGLIAEGDRGILSFQGTRFISFERELRY